MGDPGDPEVVGVAEGPDAHCGEKGQGHDPGVDGHAPAAVGRGQRGRGRGHPQQRVGSGDLAADGGPEHDDGEQHHIGQRRAPQLVQDHVVAGQMGAQLGGDHPQQQAAEHGGGQADQPAQRGGGQSGDDDREIASGLQHGAQRRRGGHQQDAGQAGEEAGQHPRARRHPVGVDPVELGHAGALDHRPDAQAQPGVAEQGGQSQRGGDHDDEGGDLVAGDGVAAEQPVDGGAVGDDAHRAEGLLAVVVHRQLEQLGQRHHEAQRDDQLGHRGHGVDVAEYQPLQQQAEHRGHQQHRHQHRRPYGPVAAGVELEIGRRADEGLGAEGQVEHPRGLVGEHKAHGHQGEPRADGQALEERPDGLLQHPGGEDAGGHRRLSLRSAIRQLTNVRASGSCQSWRAVSQHSHGLPGSPVHCSKAPSTICTPFKQRYS